MSQIQQYQNSMRDAISNVLETMFFVVPSFAAGGSQELGQTLPFHLEANIKIANDSECMNIYIRTTDRFARMITANFLGSDEEDIAPEQMTDTLKELANMAAGEFLTRQGKAIWELGVPNFRKLTGEVEQCPNREATDIELSYEEEPMAIGFSVCG